MLLKMIYYYFYTTFIHDILQVLGYRYIYTDGSTTPGKGSAGAGIYCNLFEKSISARKYDSNFDGGDGYLARNLTNNI
jgi:hypothetical protein